MDRQLILCSKQNKVFYFFIINALLTIIFFTMTYFSAFVFTENNNKYSIKFVNDSNEIEIEKYQEIVFYICNFFFFFSLIYCIYLLYVYNTNNLLIRNIESYSNIYHIIAGIALLSFSIYYFTKYDRKSVNKIQERNLEIIDNEWFNIEVTALMYGVIIILLSFVNYYYC